MKQISDINDKFFTIHLTVSILFFFTLFLILSENKEYENDSLTPFFLSFLWFLLYWVLAWLLVNLISLFKRNK